jgi:cysteinyl-tRNA synthetase
MKLYNTMSRKKEEVVPLHAGEMRIYACGPTVYNYIHIGNARPLVIFDTLRRYLEFRGYKVVFVQNFTDVDDKMINRAAVEGKTVAEIAEKYIGEYEKDAQGLNVLPATYHPRATDNIDGIISFIQKLFEGGYAYEAEGDVYFRVRAFEGYGKLSNQPLEDLESGARIDVSEIKEDPMDFALWKASKPGEPSWASPWGEGRPGWHIECSAMACRYLGPTVDIHGGGQDLIFPHHENELAQSECANGVEFARCWMHNGYINIDNSKMSKSRGNFFTVRDVAEKFGYEPIRMLMLSAQYRSPINYSIEIIGQMVSGLDRLYNCRNNLTFLLGSALTEANEGDDGFIASFEERREQFMQAMEDDLNTADAVSAIFELVRDINAAVNDGNPSIKLVTAAAGVFDGLCGVLGILYERRDCKGSEDDVRPSENEGRAAADTAEIEALIAERQQARQSRDFRTADAIRDRLREMGIMIEDTPQGVKWSCVGNS